MGGDVPAEVAALLRKEGKTKKHFLSSSATALVQGHHGKSVEWTDDELDRGKKILNKMYQTEQDELDVLLLDCKTFLDGKQGQMDENTRIRVLLGEETASARADQLESTKTKKEAEGQLEKLKEEYEAHQALCGKTLAAKRAELAMAEADYNVALKIQNMSACTDEQIAEAVALDDAAEAKEEAATEEAPPALVATSTAVDKSQTVLSCSRGGGGDDDDDADGEFLLFGAMHGSH